MRIFHYLCTRKRITMTYEEYIEQQKQALEEQSEDACFIDNQPEGQFVRGH